MARQPRAHCSPQCHFPVSARHASVARSRTGDGATKSDNKGPREMPAAREVIAICVGQRDVSPYLHGHEYCVQNDCDRSLHVRVPTRDGSTNNPQSHDWSTEPSQRGFRELGRRPALADERGHYAYPDQQEHQRHPGICRERVFSHEYDSRHALRHHPTEHSIRCRQSPVAHKRDSGTHTRSPRRRACRAQRGT
jgi:hypothetical protein